MFSDNIYLGLFLNPVLNMYHYRKVYVQCSAVELMWGSSYVGRSIDLMSHSVKDAVRMESNGVSRPSSNLEMISPELSISKPVNCSFICLHSSRSNAGFARLSWQPHLWLSLTLPTSAAPHLPSTLVFLLRFFVFHFWIIVPFLSVRTTYSQQLRPTILWRDSYQLQSNKLLVHRNSPNQNGQPASQRTALPGRAHGLTAAS
jgi:hypothetical protein